MSSNTCVICGQECPEGFWVCSYCIKKYTTDNNAAQAVNAAKLPDEHLQIRKHRKQHSKNDVSSQKFPFIKREIKVSPNKTIIKKRGKSK